MILRTALALLTSCFGASAFAASDYSLTCSMHGTTADVYACNAGNSSEGNNRYVTVKACADGDCDSDYDLMYIYAAAGDCEIVGSISFDEPKDFCIASFRD